MNINAPYGMSFKCKPNANFDALPMIIESPTRCNQMHPKRIQCNSYHLEILSVLKLLNCRKSENNRIK